MDVQLKRGILDACVLTVLRRGESYGYRINREVADLSHGAFELKEATLYTAFRRLEAAGFIRSRWGDEMSGARRRYYTLTDAGRAKLFEDTDTWKNTRELLDLLLEEA